jgi:hypothetical protein
MATDEVPGVNEIKSTPGLAGGPGPTPPGVDDGTPRPVEGDDEGTGTAPRSGAAQKQAGEVAERSAGTRQSDIDQAAREEPDDAGAPARRGDDASFSARRDPEEPDPS